jgi:hypothetical protein
MHLQINGSNNPEEINVKMGRVRRGCEIKLSGRNLATDGGSPALSMIREQVPLEGVLLGMLENSLS